VDFEILEDEKHFFFGLMVIILPAESQVAPPVAEVSTNIASNRRRGHVPEVSLQASMGCSSGPLSDR